MRSFSPMQVAVLEALRRRMALAIGRGILAILALVALLGTSFLTCVFLKIIFARFMWEGVWEHRELFPGSGSWQNEAGVCLLGLCIAVADWALMRVMTIFSLNSPSGIAEMALVIRKDHWAFQPKLDDCLESPIRRALSAVAPVLIRVPLWAIMAASMAASTYLLLLFGLVAFGVLLSLAFVLACAITPFAAIYIVVSEIAERAKKRAAARGGQAKPSFKQRLAVSLERLASEAPHALAAAEEKAVAKASASKSTKKKTLRI